MATPTHPRRRRYGRLSIALAAAVLITFPGCSNHEPQGEKMSTADRRVSAETSRFHKLVGTGSLQELRSALEAGAPLNAPGRLGETALMVAVASRDVDKMKLLVDSGADVELADDFNATALRRAVQADFEEGVRFLLSLGVERGYHPKYPLKRIEYGFSIADLEMPEEMKKVMSEEDWKDSLREAEETMLEANENPTVEPVIADVQSVAVLKLLLEAGDELELAPSETKRALLGLETEGTLQVTPDEYHRHRSPRFGTRNPERMDIAFWKDMIRTGGPAYAARKQFNDTNSLAHPVWCYERFGSSLTPLEDGRYVQVGGEHEDYYDPDFYIYNDVVVHDGNGGFQIYGYPAEVFPPTDFHTATLVESSIYIIGCLGYPEQRQQGFTPVYRLRLESWEIETVETSGEMPGWIHGHRARYEPQDNVIRIRGGELHRIGKDGHAELEANEAWFELDLDSFRWRKMQPPATEG